MRHAFCWIALIPALMVISCQASQETETPPSPTGTPAGESVFPRITTTPMNETEAMPTAAIPGAYPPPLPTTDTASAYPGQPLPSPTVAPYPVADEAWILLPVGEQCADDAEYTDLQEAVSALAAAGVPVQAAGLTELTVCSACGCPTSAHYRVQISSDYLTAASALGWILEE